MKKLREVMRIIEKDSSVKFVVKKKGKENNMKKEREGGRKKSNRKQWNNNENPKPRQKTRLEMWNIEKKNDEKHLKEYKNLDDLKIYNNLSEKSACVLEWKTVQIKSNIAAVFDEDRKKREKKGGEKKMIEKLMGIIFRKWKEKRKTLTTSWSLLGQNIIFLCVSKLEKEIKKVFCFEKCFWEKIEPEVLKKRNKKEKEIFCFGFVLGFFFGFVLVIFCCVCRKIEISLEFNHWIMQIRKKRRYETGNVKQNDDAQRKNKRKKDDDDDEKIKNGSWNFSRFEMLREAQHRPVPYKMGTWRIA